MTRFRHEALAPAGVTLVELIVAITVLTTLSLVVVPMFRRSIEVPLSDASAVVNAARSRAIRSGRQETIEVIVGGRAFHVTVNPSGTVRGAPALGFDRLSGRQVPRSDSATSKANDR